MKKKYMIKVRRKNGRGKLLLRNRMNPDIKEKRKIGREKLYEEVLKNPKTLHQKLCAGKAHYVKVIIPEELQEKLWEIKLKEGLTFSEIVVEALEDFLSEE